jgi:hypothetical protein
MDRDGSTNKVSGTGVRMIVGCGSSVEVGTAEAVGETGAGEGVGAAGAHAERIRIRRIVADSRCIEVL